ncbi:hypothetical protein XELAEV_18023635mg [Xenopus laevis]|uniref:Uncharacterized protein n=1 Tax=Xenopus laevis TaxID=8355 RepID=A0A974D5E8_XENLA|nr:hypothetical protein XELAEV_18023635mg [Xenopus laevis]
MAMLGDSAAGGACSSQAFIQEYSAGQQVKEEEDSTSQVSEAEVVPRKRRKIRGTGATQTGMFLLIQGVQLQLSHMQHNI